MPNFRVQAPAARPLPLAASGLRCAPPRAADQVKQQHEGARQRLGFIGVQLSAVWFIGSARTSLENSGGDRAGVTEGLSGAQLHYWERSRGRALIRASPADTRIVTSAYSPSTSG